MEKTEKIFKIIRYVLIGLVAVTAVAFFALRFFPAMIHLNEIPADGTNLLPARDINIGLIRNILAGFALASLVAFVVLTLTEAKLEQRNKPALEAPADNQTPLAGDTIGTPDIAGTIDADTDAPASRI